MDLKAKKQILKNHQLRVTECRLDVLELFIKKGYALSQKDLEEALNTYDRVTLYRTLHSFLEKGVLHRIPNESGFATYGTCFETCAPGDHHHEHLHFKCNECGHIECVPDSEIPSVSLPSKYKVEHTHLLVDGVCESCSQ